MQVIFHKAPFRIVHVSELLEEIITVAAFAVVCSAASIREIFGPQVAKLRTLMPTLLQFSICGRNSPGVTQTCSSSPSAATSELLQ